MTTPPPTTPTPPAPTPHAPTGPASRLDWALWLAARGWPVFPMRPGTKVPAFDAWERHATTDRALIEQYWREHPAHNIGIATGPAGLVVIDLDVAKPGKPLPEDSRKWGEVHGGQMLARLATQAGQDVPTTFTVRTPSAGTHLYYRQPAHLAHRARADQLHSTKGRLAGLIDTRAWGGCVVGPGSVLTARDGSVIGEYEVILDTPPPALADWIARGLAERPTPPMAPVRAPGRPALSAYVDKALDGECARVATAPGGEHNKAQRIAARALGELVGAHQLDYDTALAHLRESASGHITGTCGCTERGVMAVFRWGLRVGADKPRQISIDDLAANTRNARDGGNGKGRAA